MSATVCRACGRPIPPDVSDLQALVLDLLDGEGPASASTLARKLRRRKADVLAAVHKLEAEGLIARERSSRATRWSMAAQTRPGTAQEPHVAVTGRPGGLPLASERSGPPVAPAAVGLDSILAGLLLGVAYGRDRRERIAAAALLALVALAVLAAGRPAPGRTHA